MTSTALIVIPQPPVAVEIPDTIQGDRRVISEAAPVIRNLWPQIDAAKTYIAAGREFKPLRDRLSKNSRHDRTRIGWYRAFLEPEGRFGCDRRQAERCIRIFEAFGHVGHACPTSKLPSGLRALDLLAGLNLPSIQLAQYLINGTIGPNTSVRAIRKFGESLGLTEPKPVGKKSAKLVRVTIISELKQFLTKASQKKRQQFIADLLTLEPVRVDLQNRLESDQRARARANGQAKILPLPAPAKSLPPFRPDLVSAFDAATAEERQKFVRERQNEFLAAVV